MAPPIPGEVLSSATPEEMKLLAGNTLPEPGSVLSTMTPDELISLTKIGTPKVIPKGQLPTGDIIKSDIMGPFLKGILEFTTGIPGEALEGGMTLSGANVGRTAGGMIGAATKIPGASKVGAVLGSGAGSIIGNLVGDTARQPVDQLVRGEDLTTPEVNLGEAAIQGPSTLILDNALTFLGKKVSPRALEIAGQRKINRANEKLMRITETKPAQQGEELVDEIGDDMIAEVADSFETAREMGVFKYFKSQPKEIEKRTFETIASLRKDLNPILDAADQIVSPQDVKDALLKKALKLQDDLNGITPLGAREFDVSEAGLKEKAQGILDRFIDSIDQTSSLKSADKLKKDYYIDLVEFNPNAKNYDKVSNRFHRTIARNIKEVVEDLSGNKAAVASINSKLGSLYDIQKIIQPVARRVRSGKKISAGQFWNEWALRTAPLAGGGLSAALGGGFAPGFMAGAAPAMVYGGIKAAQSPTGRLFRSDIQRGVGTSLKFPRQLESWINDAELKSQFMSTLGRIAETASDTTINAGLIAATDELLENGSVQQVEQHINNLIKDSPSIASLFQPSQLKGYKSLFNGKLKDPSEIDAYSREIESSIEDPEERARVLSALHKDGTVLNLPGVTPPSGKMEVLGVKDEPEDEDSNLGGSSYSQSVIGVTGEKLKRQNPSY